MKSKLFDGKPWLPLPLTLIESDAWRSLGINGRRLIDFLMREHMRHGGAENGKLKAPQHQLEACGIGARYIAETIAQAEQLGLVHCQRNGMRTASTYALTWLRTCDGLEPSNRWQRFLNPALNPLPVPKSKNLPLKGKVGLPLKGKADRSNLPLKGKVDDPKSLPLKGKDLLRSSFRGVSLSKARGTPGEADGRAGPLGGEPEGEA